MGQSLEMFGDCYRASKAKGRMFRPSGRHGSGCVLELKKKVLEPAVD